MTPAMARLCQCCGFRLRSTVVCPLSRSLLLWSTSKPAENFQGTESVCEHFNTPSIFVAPLSHVLGRNFNKHFHNIPVGETEARLKDVSGLVSRCSERGKVIDSSCNNFRRLFDMQTIWSEFTAALSDSFHSS